MYRDLLVMMLKWGIKRLEKVDNCYYVLAYDNGRNVLDRKDYDL